MFGKNCVFLFMRATKTVEMNKENVLDKQTGQASSPFSTIFLHHFYNFLQFFFIFSTISTIFLYFFIILYNFFVIFYNFLPFTIFSLFSIFLLSLNIFNSHSFNYFPQLNSYQKQSISTIVSLIIHNILNQYLILSFILLFLQSISPNRQSLSTSTPQ